MKQLKVEPRREGSKPAEVGSSTGYHKRTDHSTEETAGHLKKNVAKL